MATEELEEDAVATMTQAVQVQRLFLHQHIVMPAARVETETTFRHPARDSRLFCGNGYYEIVSLMVRHVSIETLINIGAFDVCMTERWRAKQQVALKSFYMRSPIFIFGQDGVTFVMRVYDTTVVQSYFTKNSTLRCIFRFTCTYYKYNVVEPHCV